MVREAPLAETDAGVVATGDGWFVLNAREVRWRAAEGRGRSLRFEGERSSRRHREQETTDADQPYALFRS